VRVLVAGASGAIGRPLSRQLVAAGHEVTGITSNSANAPLVEQDGAVAVVCDALDAEALQTAVEQASPEVVISQLTRLPADYDPRTIDYGPTNRARAVGGHNLLEAARRAGARRFITQSIAFIYAPEGGAVKTEEAPVWSDAPEPFGSGAGPTFEHEREVLEAEAIDGLVLRYGQFYGPGTYYAADGSVARQVRSRRFPIVGSGSGVFSFAHVEDAAAATVAACERGAPGIYNVVDDEPAPVTQWLPALAQAIDAKPPRRLPVWLARMAIGDVGVSMMTRIRGASNAKARSELGWAPRYATWREGFVCGLTDEPVARRDPGRVR
jgi:2-alkyl-3-oxoalkanoate reductase